MFEKRCNGSCHKNVTKHFNKKTSFSASEPSELFEQQTKVKVEEKDIQHNDVPQNMSNVKATVVEMMSVRKKDGGG